MARGQQKIQAQQKAAAKKAKAKGGSSQLGSRDAGFSLQCSVCKIKLTNVNQAKQHYGAKHPKADLPSQLK